MDLGDRTRSVARRSNATRDLHSMEAVARSVPDFGAADSKFYPNFADRTLVQFGTAEPDNVEAMELRQ
jgi:hypothetical protein